MSQKFSSIVIQKPLPGEVGAGTKLVANWENPDLQFATISFHMLDILNIQIEDLSPGSMFKIHNLPVRTVSVFSTHKLVVVEKVANV